MICHRTALVAFFSSFLIAGCSSDGGSPSSSTGSTSGCVVTQNTSTADTTIPLNHTDYGGDIAQAFEVDENTSLSLISLNLYKTTAATTGTLTLRIETNSSTGGSTPSGNLFDGGLTADVDIDTIGTSAQNVVFTFNSAPTIQASTRYWMVLRGSYVVNTAEVVRWSMSDANPYEDGNALYSTQASGTTWVTSLIGSEADLRFKIGCR